jgi:hypothetical protein
MEVKNILDKLRRLDEGAQADFERREAIAKLKKLTSGNEYNDANHTYINPKTGAIIYSRDGSPMPAKSFLDPKYDTASVGLELRQLLKQVGLPVTADARGNAMVDPSAFNNLGNDPEPKPPEPSPVTPPVPKPPEPKPPEPKPPEPKPSSNGVDPKDLARFQELTSKFKLMLNKKPKGITEALLSEMGYSDEQVDEWTFTSPSSWFNGRDYGDSTSRDDVRQQDAVKNVQGGVGSALVQNRTELAPGTTSSEQGSDGITYGVNDKGQRTHKLDPGTQKWVQMDKPTPTENPELQPSVTDGPKPAPFVPNPTGLDGEGGDKPNPPKPTPSAGGVDPKDLARFQELITKFKSVSNKKPANKPVTQPPAPAATTGGGTTPSPINKDAPKPMDKIMPSGDATKNPVASPGKAINPESGDEYTPVDYSKDVLKEPPGTPTNRDSMPFGQAFADAKAKGEKEFTWKGKPYAVKMAETKKSLSEDDQILAIIKGIKV